MTKGQARDELSHYVGFMECPGAKLPNQSYHPHPYRYSRQLCIDGLGLDMSNYFACHAYAAQVNWNKAMRPKLAKMRNWRKTPLPGSSVHRMTNDDLYALAKTDGAAYKAFRQALAKITGASS